MQEWSFYGITTTQLVMAIAGIIGITLVIKFVKGVIKLALVGALAVFILMQIGVI